MASSVVATLPVVPVPSKMCSMSPVVRFTAKSPKHADLVDSKRELKRVRNVVFEGADIVEFEPTIYTTTVTSGGVPVGLSNKERRRIRRRLDSFELEREDVRVCRQNYMEEGYLDPEERAAILGNAGCEASSFETVEAEVNMIIAHRRESNEMDVQCMYGLGEYGRDDGNDAQADDGTNEDDVADDYDDQGPSPFYGNCFATADTTYEWKQTLDIIACSDMESEAVDDTTGLSKPQSMMNPSRYTQDDDSLFFLTSTEQLSDFDFAPTDIEAEIPVM
ncbi:hypothetical protein LEN26_006801 [Aphanomyces euteiches]|uniref:Uncharacterized protein n=1 Tax=Aphanomyces euteiches TaxID=100861 RepID=A0A6G0WAX4_9STRA|nr:hypothetical protein Ae201684_016936 [Aphanomyces euteiches]KAH9102766.1 hypothetical protein AeMF1_020720 [Aphanomyces euteiches]KAH9134446.1 hypothetical protein LEN26_006801 [Aphanomyces euteiches]KAH9193185.1 hypothetical protein AeNC1_004823 [Aphanomyces euteiches]